MERVCGNCVNFSSCRGTSEQDTPESMHCHAFEFATNKPSQENDTMNVPTPPAAPAAPVTAQAAAPAAPATPPAAPAAPVAAPVTPPAAPSAPAAPAAPAMPVAGSEDTPPFVGSAGAPAAPAAAPSVPAAPVTPPAQEQMQSTGNEAIDQMLALPADTMKAKERKEYIEEMAATLEQWKAWAADPNLDAASKQLGHTVCAALEARIAYVESLKAKRTPSKPQQDKAEEAPAVPSGTDSVKKQSSACATDGMRALADAAFRLFSDNPDNDAAAEAYINLHKALVSCVKAGLN